MISAQSDLMAGVEFWSLKPVLLEGDAAGVRARRILAKLIEDEAKEERKCRGIDAPRTDSAANAEPTVSKPITS